MAKAPRAKRSAPVKTKSAAKTPRAKAAPPARAKAVAAPRARGAYPVICSECYSEFDFNPATSATQITCPVCMHVGSVAERDDQVRFQIAKGRQRTKFVSGILPGVLFLIVGVAWVFLLNQKGSGEALGAGLNYGLLGAAMILFIITVFQSVKYEAARYEVYF